MNALFARFPALAEKLAIAPLVEAPTPVERAANLTVQIFGVEAIAAIDQAIAAEGDPARIGLLTRLRSRL